MSARWLPKGFHTITPNIIVDDAEQAVAFFKKAFGASESYRLTMSNGKIAHCELKLGDSIFDLGTSMDGWPAHADESRGLLAQPAGVFSAAHRSIDRQISAWMVPREIA
jgi:hypothetical protein